MQNVKVSKFFKLDVDFDINGDTYSLSSDDYVFKVRELIFFS